VAEVPGLVAGVDVNTQVSKPHVSNTHSVQGHVSEQVGSMPALELATSHIKNNPLFDTPD